MNARHRLLRSTIGHAREIPFHPFYGCPMSPCPEMNPAQAALNARATAIHLNMVLRNPRTKPAEAFYLARKMAQYVRAAGQALESDRPTVKSAAPAIAVIGNGLYFPTGTRTKRRRRTR
jgi:hypothetical protein